MMQKENLVSLEDYEEYILQTLKFAGDVVEPSGKAWAIHFGFDGAHFAYFDPLAGEKGEGAFAPLGAIPGLNPDLLTKAARSLEAKKILTAYSRFSREMRGVTLGHIVGLPDREHEFVSSRTAA